MKITSCINYSHIIIKIDEEKRSRNLKKQKKNEYQKKESVTILID